MNQTTDEVQTFDAEIVRRASGWAPWFQQWFTEPKPAEAMRKTHNELASGAWVREKVPLV